MKKIALVCTGSFCEEPNLPTQCQAYLQAQYGFDCVYSADTYQQLSAAHRAEILLRYCFDPSIDAIWAIRGGEGSSDLLPFISQQLDKLKSTAPKLLIGFSDLTALLVYFNQALTWQTVHAAMPLQFVQKKVDALTEQSVINLINANQETIVIDDLTLLNKTKLEAIEAELTGGCLSLINISINDVWQPETKNKIIFLEDVNEKPHAVTRTLKYLTRIGFFQSAKAVIIGDFLIQEDKKSMQRILQEFADQASCPVLQTKQIGHGQTNLPMIIGAKAKLDLAEKPRLTQTATLTLTV